MSDTGRHMGRITNEEFFEKAKRDIDEAGLRVLKAECAPELAGSWYIIVDNGRLFRLFWDAQAGWLVLEEELAGILNGPQVWKELWIGPNLDGDTLDKGIGILAAICRKLAPKGEQA